MASTSDLVTPYGGSLVDLLVPEAERAEVLARALRLPSVQLGMRALCDLELLATGAFSPLVRLHGRAPTIGGWCDEMRLADGVFFPMPLTLPVARPPGAPARRRDRAARRRATSRSR